MLPQHTFYSSFVAFIYLSLSPHLDCGLHERRMVCFAYPCDFTESLVQIRRSIYLLTTENTQVSGGLDDRACFLSTNISPPRFNKRIHEFRLSTWPASCRLCVPAPAVIMGLSSSQ